MQLVVVVAALALAQQPKDAKDWFEQMEKKVQSAKSVKVVSTVSLKGAAKVDGEMTVVMAEGNKLNMKASSKVPGQATGDYDKVISDGKKAATDTSKKPGFNFRDTEKDLNSKCVSLLLRAAVFTAVDELTMPNSQPKIEDLTLNNWKKGAIEKVGRQTAQIIEYDCNIKNVPVPLKCKMWIDTETMLPLKRTLVVGGGGMEFRYTEVFNEFTIGQKVDDKSFQLPSK